MVRARYQAEQHASRVHAKEFISAASGFLQKHQQRSWRQEAHPCDRDQHSLQDESNKGLPTWQQQYYSEGQNSSRAFHFDRDLDRRGRPNAGPGPPAYQDTKTDGHRQVHVHTAVRQQSPSRNRNNIDPRENIGSAGIARDTYAMPTFGMGRGRGAIMPAWATEKHQHQRRDYRR